MKVLLDIPAEFEVDYHTDRFRDFFERAVADMDIMCGTYERETADVLAKAFEESRAYDPDKVVAELKKESESSCGMYKARCPYIESETIFCEQCAMLRAIQIVKGGGVDG